MKKISFTSIFYRLIMPALVFLLFFWILPWVTSMIMNFLHLSLYKGYQGWALINLLLYIIPIIFLAIYLKKNTNHEILEKPKITNLLISLCFVILNFVLVMVAHKFLPTPVASNQNDILNMLNNSSTLGVQLELLSMTVFGPIFEELMCRGLLMNFYFKNSKYGFDIILSTVIFAALHQHQNLLVLLPYLVLGLLLGILYRLTGKVQYSMLTHMLVNTIVAWPFIQDNILIFL